MSACRDICNRPLTNALRILAPTKPKSPGVPMKTYAFSVIVQIIEPLARQVPGKNRLYRLPGATRVLPKDNGKRLPVEGVLTTFRSLAFMS